MNIEILFICPSPVAYALQILSWTLHVSFDDLCEGYSVPILYIEKVGEANSVANMGTSIALEFRSKHSCG